MEAMKVVLIRRQEDSGQKQLDNKITSFRAQSLVKHMEALGVKPEQYNEVYESALSIYNSTEIKGPFGVDFMIQAAKSLNETKVQYKVYSRPERASLVSCTTCQGTKISYKYVGDKIVGINRNENGTVKNCEDCA